MSPSSRRPLTIRDLLILITATAVGLVPFGGGWPQISSGHRELAWSQHEIVSRLSELFFPLVASYSVAMVIIRLRHPRPDLRTVAREPGAAACLAASFAVGLAAAWRLPFELVRGRFSGHYAFHDGMDRPAYAVLGAWLVLALAGDWKPEPTWIDRAGRAVGFIWIGNAAIRGLSSFIQAAFG